MKRVVKRDIAKYMVFAVLLMVACAAAAVIFLSQFSGSVPIPSDIKKQVKYKIIYPPADTITDKGSIEYKAEDDTLTFNAKTAGANVVIVEQPAPDSLSANGQVYFPALNVHPYAQFQSSVGPVALTKFWQVGSLDPGGQTAILAAEGTMVLAKPDKDLTNAEWKDFFNSFKVSR